MSYIIKTREHATCYPYLQDPPTSNRVTDNGRWGNRAEACRFASRKEAEACLSRMQPHVRTELGGRVVKVVPKKSATQQLLLVTYPSDIDRKLEPVRLAFKAAKKTIKELPPGRMRALALIDLETAFSRACFAASDMTDPIGG